MDTNFILMSIGNKLPQDYATSETIRSSLNKMSDEQRTDFMNKLQLFSLKDPNTTLIRSIFLGIFGSDMFYLQEQTKGICKLLVCFIIPFLAVMIAAIFDTQYDSTADDVLAVIWGISSCAGIVWWIKDIILATKHTKQHNLIKVLSILTGYTSSNNTKNPNKDNNIKTVNEQSSDTKTPNDSKQNETNDEQKDTNQALNKQSSNIKIINEENKNTETPNDNKQNETNDEQKDTNQTSNEQNNDTNTLNEESKTEEPKTLLSKIQAFFKKPVVSIPMSILIVFLTYARWDIKSAEFDRDDAKEAYEKKDYQTALELYEKVCTSAKFSISKRDSCYKAGNMYEKGLGTYKNPQKAYEIYTKYCDEDKEAKLCNAASVMLYQGMGVKKDLELSMQYIQKAIKFKPKNGTYLTNAAYISNGLNQKAQANEYLKKACELGNKKACEIDFDKQQNAACTPKNIFSTDSMETRCQKGDCESCITAGYDLLDQMDRSGGYELFKKACDGGYSKGCTAMGSMWENEWSGHKDSVKNAIKFYTLAGDKGECFGYSNVGDIYAGFSELSAYMESTDYDKAKQFYQKAHICYEKECKNGDESSCALSDAVKGMIDL